MIIAKVKKNKYNTGDQLVAFFINIYMVVLLIILNIILIVLFSILIWYIIKSNKHDIKCVCKDDNCEINESIKINNEQKNKSNKERVFIGRFISDEEYQQMTKNRRSEISILMEELHAEYEHLKELNK